MTIIKNNSREKLEESIIDPSMSNFIILDQISRRLNSLIDSVKNKKEDQQDGTSREYELLRTHLAQMNILLDQLINVSGSGSTIAATKKIVPFHTGSQQVGQELTPPANPDDYPTKIEVYKINDNKVIPHMTLVNDGPGTVFFINAYAKDVFNEKEGTLNVNDQRELFNVYEVRLRATLPQTTIRLIEGIFRTGSTAPQTVINVTQRPSIQANEILVDFGTTFDLTLPITINRPIPTNFVMIPVFPGFQPPLPPGETAALINLATGIQLPFTVPEGFILETFSIFANASTDFTIRSYIEILPNTSIFTITDTFPATNRRAPVNLVLNLNQLSTQFVDPLGAPVGGRKVILTVTNDDPFSDLIGSIDVRLILERIT